MVTTLDSNTALVLIDLQQGIVNLPLAHPASDVLENASDLITAFRKASLPIVIVTVNPTANPANLLRKDAPSPNMQFDESWFEVSSEIETEPEDIFIVKKTWNAFTNPALHEALKAKNITGIVLAGIATSIGVEGTARAANELGYNITFATDAMSDMFEAAHQNSMQYIFPRLGELDTTKNIIKMMDK